MIPTLSKVKRNRKERQVDSNCTYRAPMELKMLIECDNVSVYYYAKSKCMCVTNSTKEVIQQL